MYKLCKKNINFTKYRQHKHANHQKINKIWAKRKTGERLLFNWPAYSSIIPLRFPAGRVVRRAKSSGPRHPCDTEELRSSAERRRCSNSRCPSARRSATASTWCRLRIARESSFPVAESWPLSRWRTQPGRSKTVPIWTELGLRRR